MRNFLRDIECEKAGAEFMAAFAQAQAFLRDGVAHFRQGEKELGQKKMQKVERSIRDAYSLWSKRMKKLYPRMWPPPRKKLHRTSFKGKKASERKQEA